MLGLILWKIIASTQTKKKKTLKQQANIQIERGEFASAP